MSPATVVLECENLGKRYWRTYPKSETLIGRLRGLGLGGEPKSLWALREVSFALKQGEALGIAGPNGAGKSTLLRLAAGIMDPTEGRLSRGGPAAAVLAAGAGFQGELSLEDNLDLAGVLHGLTPAEARRRRGAVLEFAGLSAAAGVRLAELSAGQQARAAFSAALHSEFKLLILDEALAVGDAEFSRRSEEALAALKARGKALLVASHDDEALGRLCGRILELREGRGRPMEPSFH